MVRMRRNDARKLDRATLEALRMRAARCAQAGASPSVVARALVAALRDVWMAGALSALRLWRLEGQAVVRASAAN
jgi:hypothetical protein